MNIIIRYKSLEDGHYDIIKADDPGVSNFQEAAAIASDYVSSKYYTITGVEVL